MKKTFLTLSIAIASYFSYAQNTFPGTGNVGIGTTNPGYPLHVNGNIAMSPAAGGTRYILLDNTDTGTGTLVMQAGAGSAGYGGAINLFAHLHASKPGWVIAGISASAGSGATEGRFTVNTHATGGGTDVFTVLRSGNVGIGTTTPGYKLDVNGSMSLGNLASGSDAILHFSNNASGGPRSITYRAATAAISVDNTGGSALMTILNDGKVGIGTSTPAVKLDVHGTTYTANFQNTAASNTPVVSIQQLNAGGNDAAQGLHIDARSVGSALDIFNNSTPLLRVKTNGNVGIGTSTPNGVFHINNNVSYGDNSNNQFVLTNGGYRNGESGTLQPDNAGMAYYFTNYNAGGKHYDRTLDLRVRGASDGTYGAGMIRFFANDYTSGSAEREIMRVHGNGNVLIGKTIQTNLAYKLDIAGKARANEIVVNSDGADFVFGSDYKLPKLSAVKEFIDQNHHLPEIPSAQEMQKNGMSVGELNTKLLQKVEELTLYLIEKDKQIEEQSKSNKLLQTTLTKIEQRLKSLETK